MQLHAIGLHLLRLVSYGPVPKQCFDSTLPDRQRTQEIMGRTRIVLLACTPWQRIGSEDGRVPMLQEACLCPGCTTAS